MTVVEHQSNRLKIQTVLRQGNTVCGFRIYAYYATKQIFIYQIPDTLVYLGVMQQDVVVNLLTEELQEKLFQVITSTGFARDHLALAK